MRPKTWPLDCPSPDISKKLEAKEKIGDLCFQYWENLPDPKMEYTKWFYGKGGFSEMLDKRHLIDEDLGIN